MNLSNTLLESFFFKEKKSFYAISEHLEKITEHVELRERHRCGHLILISLSCSRHLIKQQLSMYDAFSSCLYLFLYLVIICELTVMPQQTQAEISLVKLSHDA